MAWLSLEERELGLDPSKYTKRKWTPQDYFGDRKVTPKSPEERFIEETGWSLVDQNDEDRHFEQFQRDVMMNPALRPFVRQPNPFSESGEVFSENEAKALMLKRLSGL